MLHYRQFVSLATLASLLALRISGGTPSKTGDDAGSVPEAIGQDESRNAVNACQCDAIWNPVCGTNDHTYWNEGCATCAGVDIACHGRCSCDKGCDCPDIDRPVCGVNHVTYQNNCLANCARMPARCYGRCPCACNKEVAICDVDPCSIASSTMYPHAQCFSDYCGGCIAHFIVEGKVVDTAITEQFK